jgi:HemY protein
LLARVIRDLLRLPQRWARHKEAAAGKRGRKALTGGLAAVASGDAASAARLARQADATMLDPVLSHLLTAEALILSGDNDAAEGQFELLLGREDTRVIGHRGLIEVALARGDWTRAYTRARQARVAMGKSPWLTALLIDLAVRAGDLEEARRILDQAARSRTLTAVETKRRQSALLTAISRRLADAGESQEALTLAEQVLADDPGFVPAACLAARLNKQGGRLKTAERLVLRTWHIAPHPDLIPVWREIGPSHDPVALCQWMQRLCEISAENEETIPEACLAYARAAIEAGQWAIARKTLQELLRHATDGQMTTALLLMGRLEREETGNIAASGEWHRKAELQTLTRPGWACHVCGHETHAWQEICPSCGSFAALRPPHETNRLPARANPVSLPGIGTPLAGSHTAGLPASA